MADPGSNNLKKSIGQVESNSTYDIGNKTSSAVGKYQFLWDSWGDQIKEVTGVNSKQEFRENPAAQEQFMNHYLQHVVQPRVRILKQEGIGTNLSDSDMAKMIHLYGVTGATNRIKENRLDEKVGNNLSGLQYLQASGGRQDYPNQPDQMNLQNLGQYRVQENQQQPQLQRKVKPPVASDDDEEDDTPYYKQSNSVYGDVSNAVQSKYGQYADGGSTDGGQQIAGAIGGGTALMSGFLPNDDSDTSGIVNTDLSMRKGALAMAGTGASIGSAFGPAGAIIGAGAGALIGGVGGLLGADKKQKKLTAGSLDRSRTMDTNINNRATTLDNNPYGTQMKNGSFIPNGAGNYEEGSFLPPLYGDPLPGNDGPKISSKNATYAGNRKQMAAIYGNSASNLSGSERQNMLLKQSQALRPTDMTNYGVNAGYGSQSEQAFMGSNNSTGVAPMMAPHSANNWQNTPANANGTINTNPRAFAYGGPIYEDGDTVQGLAMIPPQAQPQQVPPQQPGQQGQPQGQPQQNMIDIEKGELKIDPKSGKILQQYTGINPASGTKYQRHHDNPDFEPAGNFVPADPGQFIVTRKDATKYKMAMDNNDSILKGTIMRNIINNKDKKQEGPYKNGSYVVPKFDTGGPYTGFDNDKWNNIGNNTMGIDNMRGVSTGYNTQQPNIVNNPIQGTNAMMTGPNGSSNSNGYDYGNIGSTIGKYGPALYNMGQSFNTDHENRIAPQYNPNEGNVLGSMPQNINYGAQEQMAMRQSNAAQDDIDNRVSSSSIGRSNKNNIYTNTLNSLGNTQMQNAQYNNQLSERRGQTYNQLGQQRLQADQYAQNYNQNIDNINAQNKGAARNSMGTGISQAQQVGMNDRTNATRSKYDQASLNLIKQMYPSFNPYSSDLYEPYLNK